MKLEQILKVAIRGGASDLILKAGALPRFRHNGFLVSLTDGSVVTPEIMQAWIQQIIPQRLIPELESQGSADFGFNSTINARFRVSIFRQRGQYAMVLRVIANTIRSLEELQMPKAIHKVSSLKRGLVLVTGATGSGKSTTLAGIVQKINGTQALHVITIEDPIEFFYTEQMATINQREIGEDSNDFASALRASLRQDPDIILVGELRDRETTETALMAAETGHLVFSTLHTKDAVDSLTRLMSYFPPHQHRSIRIQLAHSLQMVISQRLVPRADGKGRAAAVEILVANSLVRDVIQNGENFSPLSEAIKKGSKSYGMQSFDQSLLSMYHAKIISKDQAIAEASSRENMRLLISGVG